MSRSSACSAGMSASGRPVRRSSARKLSTARRPLVVPERARIASQTSTSRSSAGARRRCPSATRPLRLAERRAPPPPASRRRPSPRSPAPRPAGRARSSSRPPRRSRARPRSASASSARGPARTRRGASRAPRRPAGRARPGVSCSSGAATTSVRVPRCSAASSEKRAAIALKASQSAARLPGRRYRGVEGVDEGVQVGGREVVLLVPGGGGQHHVGVDAGAVHAEVDRGEEVELALGRAPRASAPPRGDPRARTRPSARRRRGRRAGGAGSTRGPCSRSRAGSPARG